MRTTFDWARMVVSWGTAGETRRSTERATSAGRTLSRLVLVFKNFIERVGEVVCALQIFDGTAVVIAFQKMVFVGDVQRSEYRQAHRIDRVGLLGDGAHFGVDVFGQLHDVIGIGTA